MRRGGRSAITVAVVAGCLGLSACVGPTVTDAGYRNKLADTAKEISSAIASAKLAVRLELDGKSAFALTDQTVSDAESDADSAATALASRQPPTDAALHLYQQSEGPIQDAVDALRSLRIAVRRDDRAAVDRALSGLDGPAHELDQVRQAAQGS